MQNGGNAKFHDYDYDVAGNILLKSDTGTMKYGAGNRLTVLTRNDGTKENYTYDANGNQLSGNGRTMLWNSFNKIKTISNNAGSTANFEYGVDRQRIRQIAVSKGNRETTLYINKGFERVSRIDSKGSTLVEDKSYIYVGKQPVAIHIRTTANNVKAADKFRYLHRDALGSIDTITDGRGQVVERLSYDPFGKRRQINGAPLAAVYQPTLTRRGFSGHEHMEDFGLINMNARLYDADVGRFLTADTLMQDASNSRSYNRYSFVYNNPLKYIDPSGHFPLLAAFFIGLAIGAILYAIDPQLLFLAASVAAIAFGHIAAARFFGFLTEFAQAVVGGAIGGFLSGLIVTGDIDGALLGAAFGALSAGVAWQIGYGALGQGLARFGKSVAHGIARGVIGALRGGSFRAGFFSGFAAHYFDPSGPNIFIRTAKAAVIGGTAAELGGGKFANGARSAAFVYLFNEMGDYFEEKWARKEWLDRGKKFAKYGNYGGPGHAGDDVYPNPEDSPYLPIDEIDSAARRHDIAYYKNNIKWTLHHRNPTRREIDQRFLAELNSIDKSTLSLRQRVYIQVANIAFENAYVSFNDYIHMRHQYMIELF